jgi:hypothetical protein
MVYFCDLSQTHDHDHETPYHGLFSFQKKQDMDIHSVQGLIYMTRECIQSQNLIQVLHNTPSLVLLRGLFLWVQFHQILALYHLFLFI